MAANQRADIEQRIEINDLLRLHCKKEGEGNQKRAIYDEGWSDQRIFEEIQRISKSGRPFSLNAVEYTRRTMFGNLPPSVSSRQRHEQLETRVATLEACVTDLQQQLKALHAVNAKNTYAQVAHDLKGSTALDRPGRPHSAPPNVLPLAQK